MLALKEYSLVWEALKRAGKSDQVLYTPKGQQEAQE